MSLERPLSKLESAFLNVLFSASKQRAQAFSLYKRLMIPPSAVGKLAANLEKKKFIEIDGNEVRLTQLGKEVSVSSALQYSQGERAWKRVPEKFKRSSITPQTPYVPRRSSLDKDFENWIAKI